MTAPVAFRHATTPGATLAEQLRWQASQVPDYPTGTEELLRMAADEIDRLDIAFRVESGVLSNMQPAIDAKNAEIESLKRELDATFSTMRIGTQAMTEASAELESLRDQLAAANRAISEAESRAEEIRKDAEIRLCFRADYIDMLKAALQNACEAEAVHGQQPPRLWLEALQGPPNPLPEAPK